nr:MAG TPA: hypothetical protein [Caudoviricetes sp.]
MLFTINISFSIISHIKAKHFELLFKNCDEKSPDEQGLGY